MFSTFICSCDLLIFFSIGGAGARGFLFLRLILVIHLYIYIYIQYWAYCVRAPLLHDCNYTNTHTRPGVNKRSDTDLCNTLGVIPSWYRWSRRRPRRARPSFASPPPPLLLLLLVVALCSFSVDSLSFLYSYSFVWSDVR